MTHRSSRRRTAGFTLIETLIASVVLFIALFGMSLLSIAAASNNRLAAVGVESARLGTRYLNQYSVLGVTALQAQMAATTASTGGTWKTLFSSLPPNTATLDPNGRRLMVLVEANNVSATFGGTCIQLRVTVTWANALGVQVGQSYGSFVSR